MMDRQAYRFTRRDGVLLLAALLSVVVYMGGAALMGEAGFPLDDAWIHQSYARTLIQTGEWALVPGQPSAGSTAPLYTLLLSLGYVLGLPYLLWTGLLGGVALGAAGIAAAYLAERLAPAVKQVGWWAGLATVLAWHLVWAAASGMETLLFGTLTLILVALGWREIAPPDGPRRADVGRGLALGLVGAAATLTRPEGVGLVGLIGLLVWIVRLGTDWRRTLIWSAGVAMGWLAGFAPYAAFNLSLGHSILPNTAAAKQTEYAVLLAASYPARLLHVSTPLTAGGQIVLVPGLIALAIDLARRTRADRRALLLFAPLVWAVALIALYAARLPVTYQHGRYVIPALPHVIVFGVAGTALLWRRGRGSMAGRVLSQALVLTASVLVVLFWGIGVQQYGRDVQIIQGEMVSTAHWLADNVPPGELLAVHDIGAVGYFAPRPILDLAGLVSPEVVPIMGDPAALWALLEARDAQYLMALPDQIPSGDPADPRLCPVFITGDEWAIQAGGANMAVYALAWDKNCP